MKTRATRAARLARLNLSNWRFAVALLTVGLSLTAVAIATPRGAARVDPWARLVGSWEGTGRFIGADATADLSWESVLSGKFYRLTVRVSMRRGANPQVFEGHAYYSSDGDSYTTGTWFDVEGHTYDIEAHLRPDAVDGKWGPEGTVRGHSVYAIVADGLVVTDSMLAEGGQWREFGKMTYTRRR